MQKVNVPRQLATVIAVSAAVTMLASAVFYVMLRQTVRDSSAIAVRLAEDLTRSYTLLESVDTTRSEVQRALRMRDPDELEKLIEALDSHRKETADLLDKAGDAVAPIRARYDEVTRTEKQIIEAVLRGDMAGGSELFIGTASGQYEATQAEIRKYQQAAQDAGMAAMASTQQAIQTGILWRLGLIAVILAAIVGYEWRIKVTLTRRLLEVASSLWQTSTSLTSASSQVASTSQTVSQGSSEQAAALEETSAALEEMSGMSRQSSQNAEHAKTLAAEARAAAESGAADMHTMGAAMDEIRAASDNIAKIIKTIDEIAFQTNILALNAAVEAARAGEAGMGFAVVADEVRNLAQRAAQAARDTAEKIEDSIAKSVRGVQLRDKVVHGLQGIVDKARQVDTLISEIVTASQQQRQGIDQVATSVTEMEKVTQSGAASAEEGAAAAEELNGLAVDVQGLVGGLRDIVGAESAGHARSGRFDGRAAGQTPSDGEEADLTARAA